MHDFSSNNTHYFQLFIQGDERGFNQIHKFLFHELRDYAYKKLPNPFEADTIIQDAFIRLWEHRDKINDINHLAAFAKQIIRWSCCSYFSRKSKNSRTILMSDFDYIGDIDPYDEQKETEQKYYERLKQEQFQCILDAISYLPGDKQTCIKLFSHGITPKMIANITKMPYQHISSELKKTINELKRITKNIKKASDTSRKRKPISVSCFAIYLCPVEASLIKLYYEEIYDFARIAQKLNISKLQAMMQYLNIKRKLASLDKNKIL